MSAWDMVVLAGIGMVPVVLFAIAKVLRSGTVEPVVPVRYVQPEESWGQAERMRSAWDEQPCPASVCMPNRNSLMTGGYGSEVRDLGYGGEAVSGQLSARAESQALSVEQDNQLSHYQRIGGRRAAPPRLVEPETVPYFSYAALKQEQERAARIASSQPSRRAQGAEAARPALPAPDGDVVDGEWREAPRQQQALPSRSNRGLSDGRGRR